MNTKKQLIDGFTIVELLVVTVIIGILAAITVVSYAGITQRAVVTSLQSDLNNAADLLRIDQAHSSTGVFPATLAVANGGSDIPASKDTAYQYTVNNTNTPKTFCLTATKNAQSYFITQEGLPMPGPCPVLYLDAGIPTSYPGSGTTWTDLSGNGNNGTLLNGVGYSSVNSGTLAFDGIDDYVRLSFPPILGTGNFTILSVSKLTGGQGGKVVFGGGPDSTTGFYAHHYQYTAQGGTKWISGWGSASSASLSVQDYDLTSYHFAASVYDGATNTSYVDGAVGSIVAKTNSNLQAGSYWAIGSSGGSVAGNYMAGNIGCIQIYNRALSATEIQQNFNTLRGRYGI